MRFFASLRMTMRLAFNASTLQRFSSSTIQRSSGRLALRFWSFRRRRFVSKLAMANLTPGISNVTTGSQSRCAEQNHSDNQRRRRFWPFDRRCDCNCAQNRERVKHPDEVLAAFPVLIKPSAPIFIRHGENPIVPLLAEFIDRPRGPSTDKYED